MVKNAMLRNRFQKLKSYLHFVDNGTVSQHAQDRSFKVKALFAVLNNNFMKFGHVVANLSIDEMIVIYYGRNSLKQFIRGKPTRTDLLKSLGEQGFRATGTIRENRINHECPLEESKSMRKKERGTSDFAFDEKSEIFLVRWNDNSTVTVATNFSTLEPFFDVKRRVRGHKDKFNVKMPNLINSYKKHIGGVDHHDWLAGLYFIKIRGKKFYWSIFIRSMNMAMVNAWVIHKTLNTNEALNLKEFRRAVTTVYLKKL
ncbi:piggyBac transposable element-derived protein 3-like [Stegodyphus dumicola]|uniref:piggyBac transposable element-derived protein 3-like n=1 Tax=Stegodyphus dumicola TaxID=202533 RepID=UPI0015A9C70D|nr:piggyBac transposable element-derived protein 3-like [Stegodyphus dumicola]